MPLSAWRSGEVDNALSVNHPRGEPRRCIGGGSGRLLGFSGIDVSVVEGGTGRLRFDQGSREELGNIVETRGKVGCLRRVLAFAPLAPVAADEHGSGQRTQQPFEAGT